MAELEIDIEVEDGVISGTLVTDEQFLSNTVSIIIAGSGPTDRNGNQEALQNHSLEKISTSLLSHQYASFRFDKRALADHIFHHY
ncbi:hypothetical protein [Enterovibrio baiacu]|uniref:hypothetical protein n=1 Tax=Enterovibrio baiacu TaxID=2491023 RepID=UPI001F0BFEE2|nr:hypothetical protein [Enterovibrio baiacu]